MQFLVGILAYGSLIDDPGAEIVQALVRTLKDGILTPFCVEFARESRTRAGAPTLIPVAQGGAQVRAQIHVLNVPEQEAANRLWRRETGRVGQTQRTYARPAKPGPNDVLVERLENFHDVGVVLYTSIGQTIPAPTPQDLAERAIASARKLADGRDGIAYLMAAKANGIVTGLSVAYEAEILRLTGRTTLDEALVSTRPPRSAVQ